MSENKKYAKNPALTQLSMLIGRWNVTMYHVALPEPLEWEDSFEWIEDAFIIWHWAGKNEVPKSTSIITGQVGKPNNKYMMFYYDSRKVSRVFEMTFSNRTLKYWREDSDFFQRTELKINQEGNTITGRGENSYDNGIKWEHDFDITYKLLE
jgi:hypothetical protein